MVTVRSAARGLRALRCLRHTGARSSRNQTAASRRLARMVAGRTPDRVHVRLVDLRHERQRLRRAARENRERLGVRRRPALVAGREGARLLDRPPPKRLRDLLCTPRRHRSEAVDAQHGAGLDAGLVTVAAADRFRPRGMDLADASGWNRCAPAVPGRAALVVAQRRRAGLLLGRAVWWSVASTTGLRHASRTGSAPPGRRTERRSRS